MTENGASQERCPIALVEAYTINTDGILSINTHCLASACKKWVWDDIIRRYGHCSLSQKEVNGK